MILARINGQTIYSRAVRAGKTTQITVCLDERPIGYLYKRHKVFWLSAAYESAPGWARPFLDRAHWGSATVDSLRITVTSVLTRALMASLGLSCRCGAPATGFQLDPDGTKTMSAGDVAEREAVPTCLDCQYAARRAS
ncbi:MAG: hypothetical protein OXF01_19235 [Gemmatimonadetes bacterium]|nr:hypothetical protein [Gemmatimonadota bacterium]